MIGYYINASWFTYYLFLLWFYSINILECKLYTSAAVVIKALDYVVQKANSTQDRRSIIILPLVGRNSPQFNSLVNQAVEKNIVVVTPAGKAM